jgi:phytoene dehydrogenase-like protein
MPEEFDVLVIGAGFGGLGSALTLAEQGARVCICEALRYPGGCASTFARGGSRFDAGATLLSGLGPGQLLGGWLARHAPEVELEWMDPLVELRAPGLSLAVSRDRDALVQALCRLPGAPAAGLRGFFDEQRRVADTLWKVFDDPTLLPPFDARALARHAARGLDYARLLPLLGSSLAQVMARHGVDRFEPLRIYVDALCQITVQCPSSEAEAPFALAAMDYYHRGTAHVIGGVGAVAEALLRGCARQGADVRLATRVQGLRRAPGGGWVASTRRGEVRARAVVANLLPAALASMLPPSTSLPAATAKLGASVDDGWGAVMLYLVARPPGGASPQAHHLELVADPSQPFTLGNHVFASISSAREQGRAPEGRRVITVSTHVPLAALRESGAGAGQYIAGIQATMRRTLASLAPSWSAGIEHELTASPRTFARFTGRPGGAVGGIPRRTGLARYRNIEPHEALRDLWLVGDSVFPGQSALAVALGGARTAEAIRRRAAQVALSMIHGFPVRSQMTQSAQPALWPSSQARVTNSQALLRADGSVF